jgi:2-polyprenyl-3-methyl-5-hydroxy-6-metoxy-1,4-benzoquinol methylase
MACPACAGRLSPWRGGISTCSRCGTATREQAPGGHALQEHYAHYHDRSPEPSPLTTARLREWAESLLPYRRTTRVLEVGCGAGHFLRAAAAAGFEAWGTEIAASSVARLREEGLTVHEGDLVDLALPPGHFDAVVLFEVLEHLPSPLACLSECRRVLREGGLLFLTTPNFGSLSRRLLGEGWRVVDPEHLVLFTPRGLREIVRCAGFRTVSLSSRNIDPVEVLRRFRRRPRLDTEDRQGRVDVLREGMARRPLLRGAKAVANAALRWTGLGDTLEARAER